MFSPETGDVFHRMNPSAHVPVVGATVPKSCKIVDAGAEETLSCVHSNVDPAVFFSPVHISM